MASASALAVRSRVQVDQRGAAAGVAHAVHQLAEAGTRLGDQVVAGVPEIVEVDCLEIGRGDRGNPDPVAERAVPEQLALRAEDQAVRPPAGREIPDGPRRPTALAQG
jgi:hypothetical protein